MLNIERALKNDRLCKALIGVNKAEFEILLGIFSKILLDEMSLKERKRKIGGGKKGILKDVRLKLFFVLFYLKVYPTYDLAGFIFGAVRSACCAWVKKFLPMLEKTLGRTVMLPARRINSVEDFYRLFPGVKDIFIDGTERPVQRPKKSKNQRKKYSGKKKRHTRKNTIICDENKQILIASSAHDGSIHDKRQLEKMGVMEHLPNEISKWLDKAYKSVEKKLKNVIIPHKKPKNKLLTEEQKIENKAISGIRIIVEHAISGIKRFRCLTDVFRNKKGQDDSMFRISAGIWNLHLNLAQ